jgi:hypothetical protein
LGDEAVAVSGDPEMGKNGGGSDDQEAISHGDASKPAELANSSADNATVELVK